MNEGLPDPLIPKNGPGEEGMGGGALKTDGPVNEAVAVGEDASEVVGDAAKWKAKQSVHLEGREPCGDTECHAQDGDKGAEGAGSGSPVKAPADWLEPLEIDKVDEDWVAVESLSQGSKVNGSRKPKYKPKKSLGGETKKNGGDGIVAEKLSNDSLTVVKRKRRQVEKRENWLDWPVLGEGWKRREVYRRSGCSMGKTDTYYLSPAGDRVRSRIELVKLLAGTVDLTNFEFKSGRFLDDDSVKGTKKLTLPPKAENAACTEDGTTSEWSFSSMKPGTPERTKTPKNQARLSKASTPSREPHFPPAIHPQLSPAWLDSSLAPLSPTSSLERDSDTDATPEGLRAVTSSPNLHPPAEKPSLRPPDPHRSSTPNAEAPPLTYAGRTQTMVYGCSNCGSSYPGMVFRRLDQTTLCPKCKPEKKLEGPRSIVFRKVGHGQWVLGRASEEKEAPRTPPKKVNKKSKFGRKLKLTKLKRQIAKDLMPYADPQYSDPEDLLSYYDDNDDMDWGEPKKRSRRACAKCDACLRMTDCGKCDFCMDKPKFGGRNKKRQKCRLRQCKRQAMRHLLPFQMGKSNSRQRSPRHRYTYGKVNRRPRPSWEDMELTNDEDEEGYIGTLRPGVYHLENEAVEEDQGDIDTDSRAEMSQVNSVLNCESSDARLASEEVYVRTYPFTLQDGFQTGSSNLKIINNVPIFPVSLHNAGQLPSPLDTEALYQQAQLQERYGVTPELLRKARAEDAPLVLGEDVEIVEVDIGEPEERDVTPVITQIFSLANSSPAGGDADQDLLRLLASLRRTVLPAHWVGLMVEGPRLHLLQCSKLSTMADTVVQIEPGFFYQVSVQDQPLLLTHPLYEEHPPRLADVEQVVALLLDLERYSVCQGYPPAAPPTDRETVLYVRAAACSLLVPQSQERCDKCDITQVVL
ncbi:hypothetical protein MATL_G00111370 [Megalops atlanticus]|uniref:Methyl-CpG-binding domain protein 1 n=1 Tax=Megalops atlanticus TaxID=7932 RepID=A0A9D3T6R9_MEGAT|nr:hypothetical protein MATL_G00111370 [Megalops atlanticus]